MENRLLKTSTNIKKNEYMFYRARLGLPNNCNLSIFVVIKKVKVNDMNIISSNSIYKINFKNILE